MNKYFKFMATATAVFAVLVSAFATTNVAMATTQSVSISNTVVTECDLTASHSSVNAGESVTLEWKTKGFTSITVNGDSVSGDNGSIVINDIQQNSSFTLVATNDSGSSCQSTVSVGCVFPVEEPEVEEPVVEEPEEEEPEEEEEEDTYTEPIAPTCPINAKDGRTIIDFSNNYGQKIFSNWGDDNTHTDWVSTNLPAGTYDVTLASWDGYNGRVNTHQTNESYYAALVLENGSTLNTGVISDLADNVTQATNKEKVNTGLVIASAVSQIRAEHAVAGQPGAHSLAPTCIAFDTIVVEEVVPTCDLFTSTPGAVKKGDSVTLTWETTDATQVVINNGVGSVALDGTFSVSPLVDTTYKLTATDVDGDEITCEVPVKVTEEVPFTCEDNVTFTASESSVRRGTSVTLDWNVTDVDSVSISGINATTLSGNEVVTPNSDTTYVLTATKGNESIECPVTVNVTTGGGGGGSATPRCDLEISDTKISAGDEITLTWDTRNARDITLTDDLGNVIVTTEDMLSADKKDLLDSSITLKPTRNTEYTLLAERGSKDRTCKVEVEMDDIVVLESRDQQPLVAGISLSQVPYTGFEAGVFMTFMFYALLGAWASYIAYFVAVKKKAAHRA